MKEFEHVYTVPQVHLLKDFETVLITLKETQDAGPLEKALVEEEHHFIVNEAIDQGLVQELVIIRDHFNKHGPIGSEGKS